MNNKELLQRYNETIADIYTTNSTSLANQKYLEADKLAKEILRRMRFGVEMSRMIDKARNEV